MVKVRRWHSGDDEPDDGANRNFRERNCLGEWLVSSVGDLSNVSDCLLEYHLLGQFAAGREPSVTAGRHHQKEVNFVMQPMESR